MARTQLHDIEICVEDGYLRITPYKLKIQYHDKMNPSFVADTTAKGKSRMFKCLFAPRNHDIISYVFDLEEWQMRGDWEGFSDWKNTEYLTEGEAPERIKRWLGELPSYELTLERV